MRSTEKATVIETTKSEDPTKGISVVSDARHGWRKSTKDRSVVLIGENSHKVLQHKLITKEDHHVT